jgi:aconitate hydratase 2/2-methylisocitrate dehydratase
VTKLHTGDVISIFPHKGLITSETDGSTLTEFTLKTPVLLDEVRAGGRIPLIIGRSLCARVREALALPPSSVFRKPS